MRRFCYWLALVAALSPTGAHAEVSFSKLMGGERAKGVERPFDYGLNDPSPVQELTKRAIEAKRVVQAAQPASRRLEAALASGMTIDVPTEVSGKIREVALSKPADQRKDFASQARWDWFLRASTTDLQRSLSGLQGRLATPKAQRDLAFDLHQVLSAAAFAERVETAGLLWKEAKPYLEELWGRADRYTKAALHSDGRRVKDANQLWLARRGWEHVIKEYGHDGIFPNRKMEKAAFGQFVLLHRALKKESCGVGCRFVPDKPLPPRPKQQTVKTVPELAKPVVGDKLAGFLREPRPRDMTHAERTRDPHRLRRWLGWFRSRLEARGFKLPRLSHTPRRK